MHFWYPSASVSTDRTTGGRGHVAQHLTLSDDDGGPCDDPSRSLSRDGRASYLLARNVLHGT